MKTIWQLAWDDAAPEQRRTVRRWKPQKVVTWGCKLSGDKNQCMACGDWFNSSHAFERHRRGDFQKLRTCLTTEQMLSKGMERNDDYFWTTGLMPDIVRSECTETEDGIA